MAVNQHSLAVPPAVAGGALDLDRVRADFPILQRRIGGKPLVYLDNAATTQKPQCVIDAVQRFYAEDNANVHRGVHFLSQAATALFDKARDKVKRFVNAAVPCEIVFTRGTTEAINLVAQCFGRSHVGPDDEVLITHMEHHSNILPWQLLCQEKGATLRVVPIDDNGDIVMEEFDRLLNEKTRIVAVAHISNALGTVNPVKTIIEKAHAQGVPVLLDGAQSAPHRAVDVQDLGCDFFAFSGHKMYGPTGIGVLYGRANLLEEMPPYQSGGDMILSVTFEKTIFNYLPQKFEAGTPHIEGVLGLGAAIDYLEGLGLDRVAAHEDGVLRYGAERLATVAGLRLIGTAKERAGVLSFTLESAHPHDIAQILDGAGVAVRAGHHCAQPVMDRFKVPATTRASLGVYNTREEIDALVTGLEEVNEVFG